MARDVKQRQKKLAKKAAKRKTKLVDKQHALSAITYGGRSYRSGSCSQDRLRQGCRSRAYREVFTACLENSFRIDSLRLPVHSQRQIEVSIRASSRASSLLQVDMASETFRFKRVIKFLKDFPTAT